MERKVKGLTWVVLAVNIVLLLVLQAAAVQVLQGPPAQEEAVSSAPPASEDTAGTMGAGDDTAAEAAELEQWVDNMKLLAQKHNVDSYFLQELFPEQVVYKHRGEIVYAGVDEGLKKHGYQWEHLQAGEDGVLRYAPADGPEGIFGIDVSKYQGDIDWEKVKEAGVGFVFIRMGYRGYDTGALKTDEYFERYLKGASKAGIPVGVYFFSQAVDAAEAVEEAEYVMEAVEGTALQYPIVFDMEEVEEEAYRTEQLTAAETTDIALAFCDAVKAGGYQPMIYGNVSWFLARMELARLDGYDKWFAQYRPQPYYPYEFQIWQYSHTGQVDGITGEVDMNISFVDYAAADAQAPAPDTSAPPETSETSETSETPESVAEEPPGSSKAPASAAAPSAPPEEAPPADKPADAKPPADTKPPAADEAA